MQLTIALAGNPNAGKTTLFNQLTGARQKVGNWPGVTVEKKEGIREHKGARIKIVDLPGIYSLTAYSVEEVVARDFILHEHPDVVVDVLDASNLERNLYLATQLIELNIRLVFAMNMVDVARSRGIINDYQMLAQLLGVPIIPTIGTKGEGIQELLDKVTEVAQDKDPVSRHIHIHYGFEIEEEIKGIRNELKGHSTLSRRYYPRWTAVKLLENDPLVRKEVEKSPEAASVSEQVSKGRERLQHIFEEDPETLIAEARYGFISGALKETLHLSPVFKKTMSDRIDQVLTNRFLGFPILVFFMYLLFHGTFTLAEYPVEWIETGVDFLGKAAIRFIPSGDIRDLVVNGIIGGVGGVAVFLPNILLLFLGISIFEDTGYMARAAFIMDRVMHTMGLHGKSFIPLLMGFGCNVPAILAARTLETRRDRLLTILINPLMSCSARLPVYVLLAGAFFPGREGNVIFSIYFLGIALAVIMGQIFKRTLFQGESAPFVLELPPYRAPILKSLLIHMWEKTKVFIQKMGGVVLAFSIIIWFLSSFPKDVNYSMDYDEMLSKINTRTTQVMLNISSREEAEKVEAERDAKLMEIKGRMAYEELSQSYIGRMGHFFQPVLEPLGFDWRLGVSLLAGVAAKEVVVSTLGVLYQTGEDGNRGFSLKNALRKSGIDSVTAFGFMVFVLIYVPCVGTIVAIWKETGSFAWTGFATSYLMVLAWVAAFFVRWGYKVFTYVT